MIHKNLLRFKTGFTLIEITISLVILTVGILGLLALFPVGFNASKKAADATQVAILAEKYINDIKKVPFSNLDTYVVANSVNNSETDIPIRGWCSSNPKSTYNYFEYFIDKTAVPPAPLTSAVCRPVTVTIYWPAESSGSNIYQGDSAPTTTGKSSFSLTMYLNK